MALTRRTLLLSAGALTATGLGAGAAGFALTREPTRALAPWSSAGVGRSDPRLRALSHAILAPNPHNRQPWLAELKSDGEIVIFCDLDRRLPETDPFDRQITIGFGCFLELFRMAAQADGHAVDVRTFPDGEPAPRLDERPIAAIRLTPSSEAKADPLFAHVPARRTNKEPFDVGRPVSAEALGALRRASVGETQASADPALVEKLRDLTWRAFVAEFETRRTLMESVNLMRIGRAEIERNPDGIDIGGVFPEALKLAGLLTRESLAEKDSTAFKQTLDMYREIMGTGMAYLWIATPGDSRREQLAAGRDWLRINLQATALGLGLQPVSQALQEYKEMEILYAEVHKMLGGGRIQMLGRVGYGPTVAPSPRWAAETKVKKTT